MRDRGCANRLLTYMSICTEIEALGTEGLHRLKSLTTGDDAVRVVYVTTEILSVIEPPYTDSREGEMHAEFRQTLDAFLEGGEFSVANDPFSKAGDAMLARVAPTHAELWDFRIIHPSPGIRALGGFWCLDTFIVLTWNYRENFDDNWDAEIERCLKTWRDIFSFRGPMAGERVDDYLTNFYLV